MKRKRARIIYNPMAGQYPVEKFIRQVVFTLKDYGWWLEPVATQSGGHATELAQESARRGDAAAFAVGGDGTVNAVVRGLVGSETALGILPAGTSNVFARDLGLPSFSITRWWRLTHNAIILAQSPVRAVDVGWCNAHPFLLWAGIGLDALSVNHLEPRSRYQKYFNVPIYAYSAVSSMLYWRGLPLKIEADGAKVEGHYILAVLNNIQRYLGGLTVLSADAFMDDGLMDLWLFSGDNLQAALQHALNLILGGHLNAQNVRRLSVRSARISSSEPMPLQMDGEPFGHAQDCHFRVQHQALRLLTPPSAAHLFAPQTEKMETA